LVGVLTLFGEIDLQPVLKKVFMQNDLIFISENCNTGVQLMDRVNEHYRESDVVVIAAAAINMESFSDMVSEIRDLENRMRIVLILNGNQEQYLESQLLEYDEKRIDVIYDDDGFDTQDIVDLVKQGKLSKHRHKETKKDTSAMEVKPVSKFSVIGRKAITKEDVLKPPNKDAVETEMLEETTEEGSGEASEESVPEKKKPSKLERKNVKESFSQPTGKYIIGIFNVTHGAGATTACINLAKYFSLHGYITKVVDMSGTDALSLVEIKDVEIGIGPRELDYFKRESNALIMDFGTPYDITPKGDNFKISYGYSPEYIREFNKCNLKIIMGFSDKWNIGKIRFFLNNEQWREVIDDSFIFLVAGNCKKLKSEYPDINIMNRDDDYKDEILQVIKEDE